MPYIAQYLLKLSISLAVVYLFYALVLRRLTFYTWNRWYLLGYSLLAFFIPFINISPMLEQGAWNDNKMVQMIPVVGNYSVTATESNQVDGWVVSLFLLIAGIVIMLVRLLVQYLSFRHIRRSSQLLSNDAVKIYQVNKFIIPFSFGRSIFINQHQHNEEELKEIIRHEFIHVKQRHTADILWGEILCMLNWYNPFVWFIRRSIRQNLEFIADHQVLEAGLDRKQYQYLLLKVVGAPAFAIANQFNFSSLKKRIAMMNKMRSARVHLIKFMFILPLLTILLLAFRNAAINNRAEKAIPENELAGMGIDSSISISITDTIPLIGKITGVRTDSARSITVVVNKDTSRFFLDASLNGPGSPYRVMGNTAVRGVKEALFVVDGVPLPGGDDVLKTMDPSDIRSITVLKDRSAEAIYGEKGKDGVILITTKMGVKLQPSVAPAPSVKDTVPVRPVTTRIRIDGNEGKSGLESFPGIIMIDGQEYDSVSIRKIDLKPENIERIDVLKGSSAEPAHGVKGSTHGVIKISTKKRDNRITVAPSLNHQRWYTEEEAKALHEDARKNNILFVGVENQLPITIKGVPATELVVTMDQFSVQMKENIAIIKPTSPGKAELTIARKKGFNGSLEVLERRVFTIKFLPPPNGYATRRHLITQVPVQVEGRPFVIDASLRLEEPLK